VSRERDGSSVYFAPDLETLLSPVFLEDHCFRLTTGKDANLVGIAFEPTPNRKRLPEIRGTMWLDRATSGLQRLEFRYVNVTIDEEEEARGEIDFVPAQRRMGDPRLVAVRHAKHGGPRHHRGPDRAGPRHDAVSHAARARRMDRVDRPRAGLRRVGTAARPVGGHARRRRRDVPDLWCSAQHRHRVAGRV
jgi:hypothetical protein